MASGVASSTGIHEELMQLLFYLAIMHFSLVMS